MSTRASNSIIRAIKQSIADQLLGQAYFANIPVFVVIPKDIYSQIEEGTLPAKGGVAVFIEAFSAGLADSGNPTPNYGGGRITISVVENPVTNKNNPDCDEISEMAQSYLQWFAPLGSQQACTVSQPSEVETKTLSVRRFFVNLPVAFQPVILPAMPPIVITPNGGQGLNYPLEITIYLQSPVNGAAIFYTLDGSAPAPLNPSSIYLNVGPLQLSDNRALDLESGDELLLGGTITISHAATRIRARAYLAGYNSGADTQAFFN